MSAQNVDPRKRAWAIGAAVVIFLFAIYNAASHMNAAAEAKQKADRARARIEGAMRAQQAAQRAIDSSRSNIDFSKVRW